MRPTSNKVLIGVSAALLALFAAGCQPNEAPSATASLDGFKTGQFDDLDFSRDELRLPVSSFFDEAGGVHTLAEHAGKVVVLNIWGEWCTPCVAEMPTLAALQEAFDPEDVAVVPIRFGPDEDLDAAREMLERRAGDKLPFRNDPDYNITAEIESGAFPSTIIYNRAGVEVARLQRDADWAAEDAKSLIQAVLDGAS